MIICNSVTRRFWVTNHPKDCQENFQKIFLFFASKMYFTNHLGQSSCCNIVKKVPLVVTNRPIWSPWYATKCQEIFSTVNQQYLNECNKRDENESRKADNGKNNPNEDYTSETESRSSGKNWMQNICRNEIRQKAKLDKKLWTRFITSEVNNAK